MTKSSKRRMGLAYFQDAEAEAFRAQAAGSHGDAVEALCRAHELFARGSSLVEPINPSTEAALLAEQKKSRQPDCEGAR